MGVASSVVGPSPLMRARGPSGHPAGQRQPLSSCVLVMSRGQSRMLRGCAVAVGMDAGPAPSGESRADDLQATGDSRYLHDRMLRACVFVTGAAADLVGVLALVGQLSGVEVFGSLVRGGKPTPVAPAVCFLLIGLALALAAIAWRLTVRRGAWISWPISCIPAVRSAS